MATYVKNGNSCIGCVSRSDFPALCLKCNNLKPKVELIMIAEKNRMALQNKFKGAIKIYTDEINELNIKLKRKNKTPDSSPLIDDTIDKIMKDNKIHHLHLIYNNGTTKTYIDNKLIHEKEKK